MSRLASFLLHVGILSGLAGVCRGQFFETATTSVCEHFNPIYSCYAKLQEIFNNSTDNAVICPGIADYYNCSENVACKCGLTRTPNVYQSLAYMVEVFNARGCQTYANLAVASGMECPDYPENTHIARTELEETVALTLAETPDVASLETACIGLRPCYAALDFNLSRALYHKDLPSMCLHLEDFIQCMEAALCVCGKAADPVLVEVLESERATYHQTCSLLLTQIPPKQPINCTAHGVDSCQTSNPIFACSADYDQAVKGLTNNDARVCRARKDFVQCAEATACMCGVTTSTPVLRAITIKIGNYHAFGCPDVESMGNLTVSPGIKCSNNVTGTDAEAAEISLGLALSPEVADEEARCQGVKACYEQADKDGGIALFNKDLRGLCRVQDNFIRCGERTYCNCGLLKTAQVQDWVEFQRSLRGYLCDHVLPGFSEYECVAPGEGTDVTIPAETAAPGAEQNAPAVSDKGDNSGAIPRSSAWTVAVIALCFLVKCW